MHKCTKTESITYFIKQERISIETVKVGDLVYLSVRSPQHYGLRHWNYWGKITKVTAHYFSIIEYCEATCIGPNNCTSTKIIEMDLHPEYSKRWAKNSILELYKATTSEKIEEVTYYSVT